MSDAKKKAMSAKKAIRDAINGIIWGYPKNFYAKPNIVKRGNFNIANPSYTL